MDSPRPLFISIIIPIYNEALNILPLIERLTVVLKAYEKYEIIFVDDGPQDSSAFLIQKEAQTNKCLKMVCLSRNFGHQTAITTGLEHSSGDAVIIMDGDLQDPPEVIPQFIDKWREGYEVVYAIKKKRKENIFKRSAYFIFYRILKYLTPFEIPLDSGDFSIIDRKIVTILNTLPEKNRFIRGLRSWTGFKQIGLEYERDARTAEKPKYTFIKLINLAIDGLISFSDVPLKIISSIGFFFTLLSLLGIGLIFYIKIYVNPNIIQGWANIMVTIIFMGGVQFIFLGIIGEYLARIFDEVKQRPHYIIKKTLNLTPKKIDNQ